MTTEKKRTYNSSNRNAQANQTKQRILTSAKTLFAIEGFDSVTIDKIANAAGVSTPSIYAIFQSKRGILVALLDEALPTAEIESLLKELEVETCPKKRVRVGARMARCIYDSERAEMDLYRGAAMLAPEFKEIENERENRRFTRQQASMEWLAEKNLLKKGLTLTDARDIGWALTGRDLYRMLVVDRGWSSQKYEEWLGDLLEEALLGQSEAGSDCPSQLT